VRLDDISTVCIFAKHTWAAPVHGFQKCFVQGGIQIFFGCFFERFELALNSLIPKTCISAEHAWLSELLTSPTLVVHQICAQSHIRRLSLPCSSKLSAEVEAPSWASEISVKSLFSANSYDVNDIMASASPIPLQRSGSGTRRLVRLRDEEDWGCINAKSTAALRGVQMKFLKFKLQSSSPKIHMLQANQHRNIKNKSTFRRALRGILHY